MLIVDIVCIFVVQKELDGSQVLALSEVLVDQDDLRKLALNGLKVKPHVLRKHISNSREKYTEAAYNLLEDWLKQQKNRQVAYRKLIAALEDVELSQLIEEAGL